MRKVVWLGFILLGLILFAIGGGYLTFTPRVLDFYPAQNQTDVPARAPVWIEFSTQMQPESVLAGLTIFPKVSGEFQWSGNTLTFNPSEPWPRAGEVVVRLAAGVKSQKGFSLPGDHVWGFTITNQKILYLWPFGSPSNLYSLDPISGVVQQLTEIAEGIQAFTISRDGLSVFFASRKEKINNQILRLNRLTKQVDEVLLCSGAVCGNPQPSPDDHFLAYERTPNQEEGGSSFALTQGAATQIWVVPFPDGSPILITSVDENHRLFGWSPDGKVAYYNITMKEYVIWDPVHESRFVFPNEIGEGITWNPEGTLFTTTEAFSLPGGDIASQGNSANTFYATHLLTVGFTGDSPVDISLNAEFDDKSPIYSPDGKFMAIARRIYNKKQWSIGRQIWLIDEHGDRIRQLTNNPIFNHVAIQWSLDGEQLVYVRVNQTRVTDPPEIWIARIDGTDRIRLVIDGYAPQWVD